MKRAVVITTIFSPGEAIRRFAALADWSLVVVADRKTPPDWQHADDFERQLPLLRDGYEMGTGMLPVRRGLAVGHDHERPVRQGRKTTDGLAGGENRGNHDSLIHCFTNPLKLWNSNRGEARKCFKRSSRTASAVVFMR